MYFVIMTHSIMLPNATFRFMSAYVEVYFDIRNEDCSG